MASLTHVIWYLDYWELHHYIFQIKIPVNFLLPVLKTYAFTNAQERRLLDTWPLKYT